MERQRLTAKKVSIAEIMSGRFVHKTGFESSYVLTALGRRLSRVRVLGLIVDKFMSPDEKYAAITLDDGTDTIRAKVFVNIHLFDGVAPGDLVEIFGKMREYQAELYINPEIARRADPNFEPLRILELEKIYAEQKRSVAIIKEISKQAKDATELKTAAAKLMSAEEADGIIEAISTAETESEAQGVAGAEAKVKILKLIEGLDTGTGAEYQVLLKEAQLPEAAVDAAIAELLESGVCFEPRPGRIKKL